MQGRKRRNRNFSARAEQFVRTKKRLGFTRETISDDRTITIGVGTNRRLMAKRDAKPTKYLRNALNNFLSQNRITPLHFVLVEPAEATVHINGRINEEEVQEFFSKPSMSTLRYYFDLKNLNKKSNQLTRETYLRAKAFLKDSRNKGVTIELLDHALLELFNYSKSL